MQRQDEQFFSSLPSMTIVLRFSVLVMLALVLVAQPVSAQAQVCAIPSMSAATSAGAAGGNQGAAGALINPAAGGNQQPFTGIDALFVVDQSGSMGGAAYGMTSRGEGTDPLGLRFQAMRSTVGFLGDFALNALAGGELGTVRIAVIGFGDPRRSVVLDWTAVGEPADRWTQIRQNLEGLLSADTFGARNFGYTNFEGALTLGRTMFDQITPLPADERNVRVVFVVTDGEPCGIADTDANGNCINAAANRNQLNRVVQLRQTAFPPSDYLIYYLGLEAPGESFWDSFYSEWSNIVGDPSRMRRITNAGEMNGAITDYLSELRSFLSNTILSFPVALTNGRGTVEIPPYVREITFNVNKPTATVASYDLTLTDTNGLALNPQTPDITIDNSFITTEKWTIPYPVPGTWSLVVSGNFSIDVVVDQYYVSNEVLWGRSLPQIDTLPDLAPVFNQWQEVPLDPYLYYTTQNTAQTGGSRIAVQNPFADPGSRNYVPDLLDRHLLTLNGCITQPDGTLYETESFVRVPTGSGVENQFVGAYLPQQPGTYTVELVGVLPNVVNPGVAALNPNANALTAPYIPVDSRTQGARQSFSVAASNVSVTFDPFLQAQGGDWRNTDPLSVCVRVSNASGQPLDRLNRLVVEAALVDANGAEVVSQFMWNGAPPSPTPADYCSFTGTITPTTPGTQQIFVRGLLNVNNVTPPIEVFQRTTPDATANILPVRQITLQVEQPSDFESTLYIRDDYPFFAPRPLAVAVVAKDDTGALVDLASLSGNPNPYTLKIEIPIPEGFEDVTQGRTLTRVANASTYRAEFTDLSTASHQITVSGPPLDVRVCGCSYAPIGINGRDGSEDVRIINLSLPIIPILAWGFGFLFFLILAIFILREIIRWIRAGGVNPPKGVVEIRTTVFDPAIGDREGPIIQLNLSKRRGNVQVYDSRRAPQLRDTPFGKIQVTNGGDAKKAQQGSVTVSAYDKKGKLLKRIALTPGMDLTPLHTTAEARFEIWKDPGSSDAFGNPRAYDPEAQYN